MRLKPHFCYYCNTRSDTRSNECKRYKTERGRKVIAKKRKMCFACFAKSAEIHFSATKKCPTNETCFGWHSTEHHTIFCPERVEELKKSIFLPKIDDILLARFSEMLEMDEKYLLAISSPLAQKIIPLKNIKVIERLDYSYNRDSESESIYVVTSSYIGDENIEKIFAEKIFCKSRVVELSDVKIPPQNISQFFSPITKEISIENLKSEITFSDIIKKVPNIEIFKIEDSSLKINDEIWVKDLLKIKNGKNFQKLSIFLNTIEFDIDMLKEFIITKSVSNVVIKIKYDPKLSKKKINNFVDKIAKHFDEEQYPSIRIRPHIEITIKGDEEYCRYFTLDIDNDNDKAVGTPKATRKRPLQGK